MSFHACVNEFDVLIFAQTTLRRFIIATIRAVLALLYVRTSVLATETDMTTEIRRSLNSET